MSYKYSSLHLCFFAIILSFVVFLPPHIFAQIPPPILVPAAEQSTGSDSATHADTAIYSTEYLKLQKEISKIKIELGKKRNKSEPVSLSTSILQFVPYVLIVLFAGFIYCLWLFICELDSRLVKADKLIKRIKQSTDMINEQLDPCHPNFLLDKPTKSIIDANNRISLIKQQLESLSKRVDDVVVLTNVKQPLSSPINAPSAPSFYEKFYESPAPSKQPELLPSLHKQVIEAFGKSQIIFDSPQFHAMRDANAQNGRVNEEGVKALELIPAQRSEAAYLLFFDENDDWLIPNVFHSRLTQQISQMKVENSNVFDVEAIVGILLLVRAAKVQKFDGNEYRVLVKGLIHC